MHAEQARGAALIAFVLLEYSRDKAPLEFADGLGIENVASIHLLYECFQLIFHRISLFVGQTACL